MYFWVPSSAMAMSLGQLMSGTQGRGRQLARAWFLTSVVHETVESAHHKLETEEF